MVVVTERLLSLLSIIFLLLMSLECARTLEMDYSEPNLSNNSSIVNFRIKRSIEACLQNSETSRRVDCGRPGTTKSECEALGCCWDTGSNPICFIGAGGIFTLKGSCSFAQPKQRKDCGHQGITKSQCEVKNCCFDSRVPGANNCFVSSNSIPIQEAVILKKSDIERLIRAENRAIDGLSLLKARILKAHKDFSIAKTVGSGVSFGGTVSMVAGIFLAPFTGGLSTVLSVGGLAATLAGGTTSITTTIVEYEKSKEWENELVASFAPHEEELRKNAEKIISWVDATKLGGKVGTYVTLKGLSSYTMYKIVRYLKATHIAYGEAPKLLAGIWDDLATPSFKNSIKYLNTAGEIKEMTIPFNFLRDQKHFLTKFVNKLGIPTAKVGATALKSVTVGLAVAGIGLDIYTIVDTWVNDPAMVTHIDKLIEHLQGIRNELNELKNEF